MSNESKDPLRTPREAGEQLGVAPMTLAIWRCMKRYPLAYVRIGRRVMYLQSDIDRFKRSRRVVPRTRRAV